jgi:hypothetical protein
MCVYSVCAVFAVRVFVRLYCGACLYLCGQLVGAQIGECRVPLCVCRFGCGCGACVSGCVSVCVSV